MTAHRFRFFLDRPATAGTTVTLRDTDAQHLRVLRAQQGEAVEVVDASGVVFHGRTAGEGNVELVRMIAERELLPEIWLYAGAMSGQRWDALLDGAVQAGVSHVVPVVQSARERSQLIARQERADRVVEAAAKQAKRSHLPRLEEPVDITELAALDAGIVLFEQPGERMVDVLTREFADRQQLSIVVGPPAGLPAGIVEHMREAGWHVASLGPVVLRTELAAAVAVSCAVQTLRPASPPS